MRPILLKTSALYKLFTYLLALWDVGLTYSSTTECSQLRCASGAEDVEVSTYHRSRPRSAPLAACETTCGVLQGQTGPPYLVDIIVTTSSTRRHLRSIAHGNLMELRCRTTRIRKKQSVPESVPQTWNSLPTILSQ